MNPRKRRNKSLNLRTVSDSPPLTRCSAPRDYSPWSLKSPTISTCLKQIVVLVVPQVTNEVEEWMLVLNFQKHRIIQFRLNICSCILTSHPLFLCWAELELFSTQWVPYALDVLHYQGRVKNNVCVGGNLHQGDSEMSHINGTNSLKFWLYSNASVIFTLKIPLGSYLRE